MTATVTVSKPLNLRQLATELGEHPMELHDGTLTVEGVSQAALAAALAAHQAQPEPAPEPQPDPDAELVAAISAATTLAQLKDALIGKGRPSAVVGRPTTR